MYPSEIKNYLIENKLQGKLSRYGNITKPYSAFLNFCKEYNFDLGELDTFSMQVIKICILNDLPVPKCICGVSTGYGLSNGRYYAHRCSLVCRSNDKAYSKSISKTKSALYNNKKWKDTTEAKKVATTTKNYGVSYPMQNVEIFEKQQAACFKKDENGLHGYEPFAYPFLCNLYKDICLGTEYLKKSSIKIEWPGNNKNHQSYPDFFVKEINSFIEIKGEYTRNLHNYKLQKCKDRLYEMGYGYIIIVVKPKKSFTFEVYNEPYINE